MTKALSLPTAYRQKDAVHRDNKTQTKEAGGWVLAADSAGVP